MLKVMIVGAGGIAPAHIEAYKAFPERARIVAVASPTISRVQDLIDRYKLDADAITDFRDKLAEVDLLSICSPPGTHREIAVSALEAGKHVLLEKPMALSLEDCDAIIEASETGGGLLSVVAQSRFISSIANTIGILHSGEFGNVRFTQVNSFWYRGESYYDLYWRGVWTKEGGGCTLNHAVHHIDLLLWAKGLPSEVSSYIANLGHPNSEEEDLSLSVLKFADGTIGQINASLLHHGENTKLDFQMEKGGISIPHQTAASRSAENGFPIEDEAAKKALDTAYAALPMREHEHHEGQVEDFLNAVETGSPLTVDGRDGRKTIELITGIYKSANTKETVRFPIKPDDPYYSFPSRVKDSPRFHQKTKNVRSFTDSTITDFKGKF